MNELASAINSSPACTEVLGFAVADAAEIMIAAATSATAIGAIQRRMFMDSQLLSVRANRRSASWSSLVNGSVDVSDARAERTRKQCRRVSIVDSRPSGIR